MPDKNLVNGQITDAVTQSNITVIASAPGMALGNVYQTMAQAISIGMQNAAANQQQVNELGTAILTRCIRSLTPESGGK